MLTCHKHVACNAVSRLQTEVWLKTAYASHLFLIMKKMLAFSHLIYEIMPAQHFPADMINFILTSEPFRGVFTSKT